MLTLPVVLLPIVCAPFALLFEKKWSKALFPFCCAAGAAELALSCALLFVPGSSAVLDVCGGGLGFAAGGFGTYYTVVSAVCFFFALVFSGFYFKRRGEHLGRFYMFWLLTEGAVAGVFLSADLFTLFLFFELMGLASWVWVMHEETPEAGKAADTYLGISVIGGLVMLMGILLVRSSAGTLKFSELALSCSVSESSGRLSAAAVCLLFGFGAKAGMFPLHIWLPKAHPAAPAPASAVLSGILTKTGVFGIAVTLCRVAPNARSFGTAVMLLGTATMLVGALMAVVSADIKRTLACSSVSQIGFILIGVSVCAMTGGENSAAAYGTLLHMTNHSVFKLILFCVAGIIYANVHSLDLNKIRGFGTDKPLLKTFFCIGALGISGFPLFSGYASKTLLHEGIVELGEAFGGSRLVTCVEWLFLIAGGLTAAYMLKLFFCVFTGKPAVRTEKKCMNAATAVVLGIASAAVLAVGAAPGKIGLGLASPALDLFSSEKLLPETAFFSLESLKGAAISLSIGAALYFGVVRTLVDRKSTDGRRVYRSLIPEKLELETLYRFVLLKLLPAVCGWTMKVLSDIPDIVTVLLHRTVFRENKKHYIPEKGTRVTHIAGLAADRVFPLEKKKKHRSFEDVFADAYENLRDENRIVVRSLSFSLLAACAGIALTLIYIFIRLIIA